jgi:hypothetical protein
MTSKLVCLVLNHKWEMHNSATRGDWRTCARCGKEQDFHPSYEREGMAPDRWAGRSGTQ